MSFINNITCSMTCHFNSDNRLVSLAKTIAMPCKWLLGTKTLTVRYIKNYAQKDAFIYTASTDNYIKIAIGIMLYIPAAIFSTLCINWAASYDKGFNTHFSQVKELFAYNQLSLMVLEKQKNKNPALINTSTQEKVELVQLTIESFSTLTWFEKIQSFCWIASLPKDISDLLNMRSKNKQDQLNKYKKALDWAKCNNAGAADLPTLYQCMPTEIFKDFFEANFLTHITDNNNINKEKGYWESPSREQQCQWLCGLLKSVYEDEAKKEFIKQKLCKEIKSQLEIIEILEQINDFLVNNNLSMFSDYLSEIYETEHLETLVRLLDSEFGEIFIKCLPFDYHVINHFLSLLSKEHLKFVLKNTSKYDYFNSSSSKDLRPVSVFVCVLDLILDNKYQGIKLKDIEEDVFISEWVFLFELFGKKHVNCIPELIEIYRNKSSFSLDENYIEKILDLLSTKNKTVIDKIFRSLKAEECKTIQKYLINQLNIFEEDKLNNDKKISSFEIQLKNFKYKKYNRLLELVENPPLTVPSLFTIIVEKDLMSAVQIEACPDDIKEKINRIKGKKIDESIFFSLKKFKFV